MRSLLFVVLCVHGGGRVLDDTAGLGAEFPVSRRNDPDAVLICVNGGRW